MRVSSLHAFMSISLKGKHASSCSAFPVWVSRMKVEQGNGAYDTMRRLLGSISELALGALYRPYSSDKWHVVHWRLVVLRPWCVFGSRRRTRSHMQAENRFSGQEEAVCQLLIW